VESIILLIHCNANSFVNSIFEDIGVYTLPVRIHAHHHWGELNPSHFLGARRMTALRRSPPRGIV
jgi:hypothetical protein